MTKQNRPHWLIGNAPILIGLILLAVVAGYLGWQKYRGQTLAPAEGIGVNPVPTATAEAELVPTPAVTATAGELGPAPTAMTGAGASSTSLSATQPEPAATPAIPPTAAGLRSAQPTGAALATMPSLAVVPATVATPASPPVRIVIPDLGIDAPVVEMGWRAVETASGPQSEWVIPQNEAGHHINSASPGEPGNIVISGHNNIYGRVFEAISLEWDDDKKTRVDDVADRSDILNGRLVRLYNAAGQQFDYTIREFYRLKDTGVSLAQRIENARFMQSTVDTRLTLVTCWPITANTYRLVLIARPADQP